MTSDPQAHPLTSHLNFKLHHIYRLSYTARDPVLRGLRVVFLGWVRTPGDIQRALVAALKPDGGHGTRFSVSPSLVLPLA